MSKPFSLEDMILHPREDCEYAKNLLYRFNNELTYLIGPSAIGGMVYLNKFFQTGSDPKALFDVWTNMDLFKGVTDKTRRGRYLDELYDLVHQEYDICMRSPKIKTLKQELTYVLCWQDILFHAIYQTIDGCEMENLAVKILKEKGKKANHTDPIDDFKYSTDLLLYVSPDSKKVDKILQVKPVTFFYGGDWFPKTIVKILSNAKRAKELYGADYYFLIYDKTSGPVQWLFNENRGDSFFKIDELINDNKLILNESEKNPKPLAHSIKRLDTIIV